MPAIPTNEPRRARAGDTWKWRRDDLTDYPAPTWTLKYRFRHPTLAGFEVVASADGTAHAVTVPASTTASYTAGTYHWLAWVESGAEKYEVDEGSLEIVADLRSGLASATQDLRSPARRIYESLLALYEDYAAGRGLVKSYTIGTRTMTFHSPAELLQQIGYWRAQVEAEERAERIRNGLASGTKLYVRSV